MPQPPPYVARPTIPSRTVICSVGSYPKIRFTQFNHQTARQVFFPFFIIRCGKGYKSLSLMTPNGTSLASQPGNFWKPLNLVTSLLQQSLLMQVSCRDQNNAMLGTRSDSCQMNECRGIVPPICWSSPTTWSPIAKEVVLIKRSDDKINSFPTGEWAGLAQQRRCCCSVCMIKFRRANL